MIETKGTFQTSTKAFGGTTLLVESDGSDDFFKKNRRNFTEGGMRAFLRALSTPPSFFQQQEETVQDTLLTAQKHRISTNAKHVAVLRNDEGELIYASPVGPMGTEDPTSVFGFTEGDWLKVRTDYDRGLVRYKGYGDPQLTGYSPCLFVTVPMYYNRAVSIEMGMFKLKCSNGAIDNRNAGKIQVNPKAFNRDTFIAMLLALKEVVTSVAKDYKSFEDYLLGKKCTPQEAKELYSKMLNGKVVPKTLINRAFRHVDLTVADKEVEDNSPKKILTQMDALDVLTFHSQSLVSLSGQNQAERNIFNHFYDAAAEDLGSFLISTTRLGDGIKRAIAKMIPTEDEEETEKAASN